MSEHIRKPIYRDRIDAGRLLDTNPEARAIRDTVAAAYLRGTLTVAEIRILTTLGLEYGMEREVRPMRFVKEGDGT